ncbi:MAG TPA: hypothetical protein VIL36_08850 [Acidimicrobiales bacterium]
MTAAAPPPPASVRVTVTVRVDPPTAFAVFTEEIDAWYRRGLAAMAGHRPRTTLRFEPGVGGRLLEVGAPDGDTERGRITVWAPGERLVFVDGRGTEVDVTFAATGEPGVTRVALEHRGLDRLPPTVAVRLAKFGWRRLADWFEAHLEEAR